MNPDPQITRPIGSDKVLSLPVLSEVTVLRVVAYDPEDELLTFVWDVPRATTTLETLEIQSDAGDWISTIHIPDEWLQPGDMVRCSISDQAAPRNVVSVEWEVSAQ